MSIQHIAESGTQVHSAEAQAAKEDAELLAAVRALPLPGARPSDAQSATAGDAADSNVQLVRALNALLPSSNDPNGAVSNHSASAFDGGSRAAAVAATQRKLCTEVEQTARCADDLLAAANAARMRSEGLRKVGDDVDKLTLSASDTAAALTWAVQDANVLGSTHFPPDHELHSFATFLRANPLPSVKKRDI